MTTYTVFINDKIPIWKQRFKNVSLPTAEKNCFILTSISGSIEQEIYGQEQDKPQATVSIHLPAKKRIYRISTHNRCIFYRSFLEIEMLEISQMYVQKCIYIWICFYYLHYIWID